MFSVSRNRDLSAMELDETFDERQTERHSPVRRAVERAVKIRKGFKQLLKIIRGWRLTGITNCDVGQFTAGSDGDFDRGSDWRTSNCVHQEVRDHQMQSVGISINDNGLRGLGKSQFLPP
jgi:hypothetical protein